VADWAQAMTQLMHTRGEALKRYAFLLCGNDADADDLVQEAIVRAFARPGRRDVAEAEAYVRRILLNRFLDGRRRQRSWLKVRPLLHPEELGQDQAGALAARADVRTALAGLSPRQRACAVLRYYEDFTIPQIAAALGCQAGTVKRHLSEAHARLAAVLADTPAGTPAGRPASPSAMESEEAARWNPTRN
jgi:RNA polymerase sigma factor (sigma-70 family)